MSLSNALTLEARARQSLGSSHDAIYRMVDRALADRGIAGGRLVDVGCGSAGLWRLLAPRFATYCGLDAVRYEGFPADAEFCQIDLDDLDDHNAVPWPIALCEADVVTAVETIEHLENPWAFVRALVELARPGGWVVVTTPNQLSVLSVATLDRQAPLFGVSGRALSRSPHGAARDRSATRRRRVRPRVGGCALQPRRPRAAHPVALSGGARAPVPARVVGQPADHREEAGGVIRFGPTMTRALFVNSGMLGHRAFAGLMNDITALVPGLDARHIDLSRDLTIRRSPDPPAVQPAVDAAHRSGREPRSAEVARGIERRPARGAADRGGRTSGPFDVLHFHTQATAYASLARMKRTPAIVSLDCTQHLASLEASSRLGRASYQANIVHDGHVFRAAAAIVSTSEWAARDLAAGYPDCASKVCVLPFPVDVEAFSGHWIAERAARARAGNGYRPRVLFMGGDFPRKGGPDLLEAWREGGFAARADLDVVTDWPLRAETVPPGAQVISGITPYTDRWLELWRRADLFVMPARHEAFGIVYEEAGASGIPAIGSDINAIPEIIRDGGTGFLVPPAIARRSSAPCARSSIRPVLRERMGRAARQYVTQRAAVPVYAAKLGSIIGSVVTNDVRQPA